VGNRSSGRAQSPKVSCAANSAETSECEGPKERGELLPGVRPAGELRLEVVPAAEEAVLRVFPRDLADLEEVLDAGVLEAVLEPLELGVNVLGLLPHRVQAGKGRNRMTEEAKELHRIIDASVRDMLDAYRIQAQAGPVTDKALEPIIFRAALGITQSLAPYPAAQRVALLPSVVRFMLATFLEETARPAGSE